MRAKKSTKEDVYSNQNIIDRDVEVNELGDNVQRTQFDDADTILLIEESAKHLRGNELQALLHFYRHGAPNKGSAEDTVQCKELSRKLSLSIQRVRQIQRDALWRMKRTGGHKMLKEKLSEHSL